MLGFTAIVSVKAQDVEVLFSTAKGMVVEQNYSGALSKYQEVFETGQGDSTQLGEAYGFTGISYEELGNKAEALNYYKKALDHKVLELSVYDKAIALSKEMKKDALHEWMLKEKLQYFPDFEVEIIKSLNTHYLKTKQYDQLLGSSESLIKWFPDSPKYPYYKGFAYQNIGKVDSAVVSYKESLLKDANYTSANVRLGHILFEKANKVYSAKKKAYEAIANPTRVDYSKYHKSLDQAKAIYKEAEVYLSKAYENKQDPQIKKLLFAVYMRLGEKDKAQLYK